MTDTTVGGSGEFTSVSSDAVSLPRLGSIALEVMLTSSYGRNPG